MLLLLALPIFALVFAGSPGAIRDGVDGPLFGPALRLSLGTSVVSLAVLVMLGTPLDAFGLVVNRVNKSTHRGRLLARGAFGLFRTGCDDPILLTAKPTLSIN